MMNPNTNTKTLIKELESASRSYCKAEQFANSIPSEKMLSAPSYLKDNIRSQTVLLKKAKHVFSLKNYPLLRYSLRVCFTMCCSLFFLFSEYSPEPYFYLQDRTIRFEQITQPNQILSTVQTNNSKEDSYYD